MAEAFVGTTFIVLGAASAILAIANLNGDGGTPTPKEQRRGGLIFGTASGIGLGVGLPLLLDGARRNGTEVESDTATMIGAGMIGVGAGTCLGAIFVAASSSDAKTSKDAGTTGGVAAVIGLGLGIPLYAWARKPVQRAASRGAPSTSVAVSRQTASLRWSVPF